MSSRARSIRRKMPVPECDRLVKGRFAERVFATGAVARMQNAHIPPFADGSYELRAAGGVTKIWPEPSGD
jgi:hypothetical protein